MAKKIIGTVKLQIAAGVATSAPPVGPALGPYGMDIGGFCKQFNAKTKDQPGMIIPVVLTVYQDRTFSFITKTPPAAVLLLKAAGLEKGSGEPNKIKVGKVTMAGYNGGYGLYVKLQHNAEIGTAYAHLSRLGPGIKPGVSVRQGQVVGFVGSTGMSTGPHLHYEFYRGGRAINPLAQKFAMRGNLGGKDLTRFQALSRQYVVQLKNAPAVASVKPPKAKEPAPPQVAKGD